MMLRRPFLASLTSLVVLTSALVVGCGTVPRTASQPAKPDPQTVAVLAPTGKLRIGVYKGSPTSMVLDLKTGEQRGVALQLGQELARQLGVPFEVAEFPRLAEILIAMKTDSGKAAKVDFTFTNATAVRAKDVDFTAPLIGLELGYLVPKNSNIQTVQDVDKTATRVGVAQGSSSQAALGKAYSRAVLTTTPTLATAAEQLKAGTLDAFATNKAILFELLDSLPTGQFRILDDRWGLEHIAIAVPKGREVAAPFMNAFASEVTSSGLLQKIADGAGLRGMAKNTTGEKK
jgi:polar amino acid transport system substrate-binding protein